MANKPVITIPDPILTSKSAKVKEINDEVKKVVEDLIDSLETAKDPEGAGLAAPQIGYPLKICVVKNFFEDPTNPANTLSENIILINPKIISHSTETDLDWEGCLSVPNLFGKVERYKKIKVSAMDINWQSIKVKASDFFARVLQHEIDHLEGILFTEKVVGKPITEKELDELYRKGDVD
jgi:peptide deformylase